MNTPTHRWPAVLAVLTVMLSAGAQAQGALEVLPVQGNVWLVSGPGGNTTIQTGHEAVVLVDTQTEAVSDELLAIIEELSPKPIRHIIVTSADADHTGGNAALSNAGTYVRLIDSFDPRGSSTNAAVIAHINVLATMSSRDADIPADAWPSDTYFTKSWELFVNDEAIQLLHVSAAHTDGDTMVFFRRSDVISTGDIFNTDRYPMFDPETGGINGIIDGLNLILEITIPGENQEGGTVVIPGHGRLSDETDVANYRDMVTIVRDRVQAMIDAGKPLAEVLAARPTLDYDARYSNRALGFTGEQFIETIFRDLGGESE
jgi:cyclase